MSLFVFLWCTSVEFYCLQIKGFSCYSDAFYLLAWQVRLNHRWKKPRDILSAGKHIHIFIQIYILWSLTAKFLICRCLYVLLLLLLEKIEFLFLKRKWFQIDFSIRFENWFLSHKGHIPTKMLGSCSRFSELYILNVHACSNNICNIYKFKFVSVIQYLY